MEHTKHLWRAAVLLIAMSAMGFTVRHFMAPASFGEHGFYRYGSAKEFMAQPLIHGDKDSCTGCHAEIAEQKSQGVHMGISCEVCHAPLARHASGEEKIADMPIQRAVSLCANCHEPLAGRPESMPQINPRQHLVDLGVLDPGVEELPEAACIACHDAHSPGMG